MNRVVVTGIGCLLPCGDDVSIAWNDALNGNSWVKENKKCSSIQSFRSKVCSSIDIDDDFVKKYEHIVNTRERRRLDDFEYVALIAGYHTMADANLLNNGDKEKSGIDFNKIGTFVASGIGGLKTIQENVENAVEKGYNRISPFFLPAGLGNMCAGNIALKFGLKGASISHVSACASSTHSIGEAFCHIREGRMDGCIAGGSEMAICNIGVGGFDAMKALSSKFNDNPKKASRALDRDRDGFVIGEGAVLLMLENEEIAKKRGAKIYCEIVGYGASCDAYHITTPDPEGTGAVLAMQMAIKDANIQPNDIDYINLHGTSTPVGDIAEISAIKKVFGNNSKVALSSTKSITGHLLGATGALEAMFCAKTLQEQIIPMSANIDNLDEKCEGMNIIMKSTQQKVKYAMSNSFGFGGTNGCLVFKKYEM